MKNNDNQPIIDALLGEWLGNQKPSSLSAHDLAVRQIDPQRVAELEQALNAAENDLRNRSLASSAAMYRKPKTHSAAFRAMAMLAACLVVAAGAWTILNRDQLGLSNATKPPIVVAENDPPRTSNTERESAPASAVVASNDRMPKATILDKAAKPKSTREALPLDSLPFNQQNSVASKSIPSAQAVGLTVKLDDQGVVKVIDRGMLQLWNKHDAKPAAPISGVAWIERTARQILSRPASQQEKDVFQKKDSLALRLESLHGLVESTEFSQVWAKRLGAFYLDVDLVAMRDMSPERRAFVQWIRKEINQTRRLDTVVKNIVLAEGIESSASQLSPSMHWWSDVGSRNITAPAEIISSKFLGTRASCSRCHDARTVADADQSRFWGVAAILQAIEVPQPNDGKKPELRFRKEVAPLFYERADATMVAALPSLPNGQSLAAQQGNPPELATIGKQNLVSLSEWMLQSDELARSHVDFVWKSLLGQPLVGSYPLDETEGRTERTALAEAIAQQLRSNQYDLRKLVTWIAASQVFGLESTRQNSRWYLEATDKDLALNRHRQALFASYPSTLEPAFRSIDKLASWLDASKALGSERGKILANPLPATLPPGKSTKPIGGNTTPIVKTTEYTEAQVQYLVNAQLLPKAVQAEVDQLIKSKLSWRDLVDHAFYMTGSSPPSQADRDAAQRILDLSRDKRLALSHIIAARL